MRTIYRGGCACQAVRYETTAQPVFQNHCHCTDCQKRSGTGHGSYLTFPQQSAVERKGKARFWSVAGDSGHLKNHGFCPTCGTPVYLTFDAMPDLLTIHAGSLDDPGLFTPTVVTYGASGHGWDAVDTDLVVFKQMPTGQA